MRQTSGYAILRLPTGLISAFDLSMRADPPVEVFQQLCDILKPLPRTAYRGISRSPLQPLPLVDSEFFPAFEATGYDLSIETAARAGFREWVGGDVSSDDHNENLLPDLIAVRDVFSCLESPDEYEIVQLVREPYVAGASCLGFDVGNWGSEHYPILCDSAMCPEWHPPQPESFVALRRELETLNESFLFPTAADAARFRSWYQTQDWAETIPTQFCIIQVNRPLS